MTSILSTFFLSTGVMGLFITQGSISTFCPPGVSIRKVAWPSQVSLIPFSFILAPLEDRILKQQLGPQLERLHGAILWTMWTTWTTWTRWTAATSPVQSCVTRKTTVGPA